MEKSYNAEDLRDTMRNKWSTRTNHVEFTLPNDEHGVVWLMSYRSLVAGYHKETKTIYLFPRHAYSSTTSKHVTQFFRRQLGFRNYFSTQQRREVITAEQSTVTLGTGQTFNVQFVPYSIVLW